MDSFLNRLIAVLILFPIGMHGIGYGVEINGGAYPRNPIWRMLQSYFAFEKGVIEFLLFLGGLALLVFITITLSNRWMDQKKLEREERAEAARKLEHQLREERYEREQEAKRREEVRRQKEQELNTPVPNFAANETQNSVAEVQGAKILSPEEIKRRALAQFKGGK